MLTFSIDRLRLPTLFLAVLLAGALPGVAGAEEAAGDGGAPRSPPRFLGIDAVDPFLDASSDPERLALLAGIGDLLVRTTPIPWGRIEPQAPLMKDRQLHDWEDLDRFVARWTAAGFEVVLVLSPICEWGSTPAEESAWRRRVQKDLPSDVAGVLAAEAAGATVPRAEHWKDWEGFVTAVAERYDGDGEDDAEGLARPVRWIQILDRASSPGSWLGSGAEYSRLLHLASQGAAKASAAVRVVHGAVDFRTLGHRPFPTERELFSRVGAEDPGPLAEAMRFETRWALSSALLTLTMRRLYAAVPHVGSGHLADEDADVSFLRHLLDTAERPDLEVWLGDSPSAKLDASRLPGVPRPSRDEERVRASLRGAARSRFTDETERAIARQWLHTGQVYDLVRTIANAKAAGATRVFLGGIPERGEDALALYVDADAHTSTRRLPAWYALRQASRLLGGRSRVETARTGTTVTAHRFAFSEEDERPWVMVVARGPDASWAGNPRDEVPLADTAIPLPDGTYVVEQIAWKDGEPARSRIEVKGGTITLPLSPAPVYIYPDA